MELLDTGLALRSQIDPPGEVLPLPKLDQLDNLGFFYKNYENKSISVPRSIPYFQEPTLPLDLSSGFSCPSPSLSNEKEEYQYIMKFIAHHKDNFLNRETSCLSSISDYDFITIRGFLCMIMSTPYKDFEDWRLHATRYRGSIYLNKINTAKQEESNATQGEKRKKFREYGQIFKKFCLKNDPTENNDKENSHTEDQKLYCMFSLKLQDFKILSASQVDGEYREPIVDNQINSNKNNNQINDFKLVDVKYSVRPSKFNQEFHYLHKYRHWWCQNFLSGIEDLMVGYRDRNGLVEAIEHIKISELPAESEGTWNPSQCIHFLVRVLKMIKEKMKHLDCPNTVFEFYYDPESKKVQYRIYEGRTEHSFLLDEYVSLFE